MKKRSIKTKLVQKNELFKILAISESLQSPILFIGEPGVAKTQAILDYAGSKYATKDEAREKCFFIELDEGSQTSEIKGRMDMKKFMEYKIFTVNAPIAQSDFIMINEVDKGSSGIRNSLLSIMRERALFLGHEVRKCVWTVFAGACNSIPDDEKESPFWDRFIIKYNVERLSQAMIPHIWDKNTRSVEIVIPTSEEIEEEILKIPVDYIMHFLNLIYSSRSDRTLAIIPRLIATVKLIYNFNYTEATIKTCELIDKSKIDQLAKLIESREMGTLKSKIFRIDGIVDESSLKDLIKDIVADIEVLCGELNNGSIHDYDYSDLISMINLLKSESKTSPLSKKIVEEVLKESDIQNIIVEAISKK